MGVQGGGKSLHAGIGFKHRVVGGQSRLGIVGRKMNRAAITCGHGAIVFFHGDDEGQVAAGVGRGGKRSDLDGRSARGIEQSRSRFGQQLA